MSRRLHRGVAVGALALAAGVLTGCGSDAPDEAAQTGTVDGAALYAGNCAACHGGDLRGTGAGPSLLSVIYEPGHHSDQSFLAAVRNGVTPHHWGFGAMPPIAGLSDADVAAIVAFVRATQQREGFEPLPAG